MGQQAFSGIAALVALFFIVAALSACSTAEQVAVSEGPALIAPLEAEPGTPEFHGARIGRDTLRGHLTSES
jgi:hypothetical protein